MKSSILLTALVLLPLAGLALQALRGEEPRPDWLVVELSSYQIEQSPELAPAIGSKLSRDGSSCSGALFCVDDVAAVGAVTGVLLTGAETAWA